MFRLVAAEVQHEVDELVGERDDEDSFPSTTGMARLVVKRDDIARIFEEGAAGVAPAGPLADQEHRDIGKAVLLVHDELLEHHVAHRLAQLLVDLDAALPICTENQTLACAPRIQFR